MGIRLKHLLKRWSEKKKLKEIYPLMIIHLYSLSTASPSSRDIMKMAGKSFLALSDASKIFSKISTLVEKWGYTLHKAARYVASQISEEGVKKFLQRLSDSVNVNVDLRDFMRVEYEKMMANKITEFDRAIERVKRYIEAYSAIMTSNIFLSVSMLLTSMIYGIDVNRILIWTIIAVVMSLAFIAFFTSRSLPRDPILHSDPRRPEKLASVERMNPIILVTSLSSTSLLILSLMKLKGFLDPISAPMLLAGAPLLMIGWVGKRWVKSAREMDENYAPFVKSLGDALEVSGSLKSACKVVSINDYGPLNKLLKRLGKRLELGFEQGKAVEMFGVESLSNLILSTCRIEADSLRYGSRQSITSKAIHDYVLSHLANRKKRRQVAGAIRGLALPLQAIFSAISALISVLTKMLSEFARLIQTWFPVITPISDNAITIYFSGLMLVMAVASSYMIYSIEGDSKFTFTYQLGILLTISGIVYHLALLASMKLLNLASGFMSGMEEIVEGI